MPVLFLNFEVQYTSKNKQLLDTVHDTAAFRTLHGRTPGTSPASADWGTRSGTRTGTWASLLRVLGGLAWWGNEVGSPLYGRLVATIRCLNSVAFQGGPRSTSTSRRGDGCFVCGGSMPQAEIGILPHSVIVILLAGDDQAPRPTCASFFYF